MTYKNITPAKFIVRPNRFIANIDIEGNLEVCHVKNTGRCKELLTENASVFVQKCDQPSRKTKFDLISVYKGERLVNIDSQVPNKLFAEFIPSLFKNVTLIRPEYTYKSSRFDFYIEADEKKIFVEVKGATLEEDGVVVFPDAPTVRGLKHVNELIDAVKNGYEGYVFFVIQMRNVKYFTPNYKTHKEFALALKAAKENGVNILAYDCEVGEDYIFIANQVEVVV